MPKRTDIKKILIIGSGPIIISQACEFDYSGTQACKALREEGFDIVLINSNPATIMTDPETAQRTYIEPITPEWGRHYSLYYTPKQGQSQAVRVGMDSTRRPFIFTRNSIILPKCHLFATISGLNL